MYKTSPASAVISPALYPLVKAILSTVVDELDGVIDAMLNSEKFFLADIRVAKEENCFPMIPSGAAHNEMILNSGDSGVTPKTTTAGMALV